MSGGKRSIADTYVSIIPETARVAAEVARAFRSTDREARDAGKRWARAINDELRDVHATVSLDAAQARADATRLREEIAARHAHLHVDVDYDRDRVSQLSGSLISSLLPQLQQTMMRGGSQAGAAFSEGAAGGMQAGGPAIAAAVVGLAGVAAQASGAIGLIPAAAVGAGAAVGALALAFDGFGDAMKNIKDPEKFAESLGQLAPNAQAVATSIQGLMPVFDRLKFTVSDAFFGPLTKSTEPLVNTYMPMLQGGLSQMASVMGNALGGLASFMQTPEMLGMAGEMTNNLVSSFSTFSGVLQPVVHALTEIGAVGSSFLPQIAQAAVQAAQGFSDFISQAAASGQLQEWIQGGITAMGQLFELGKNLIPVFGALSPIGSAILPAINQVVVALTPGIQALGGVIGNLITAASPLLTYIGEMASTVVSALAPAFNTLLSALGPVVQQLIGVMKPIMEQLAPVLGQVASILGEAMAQAATDLMPLIAPLISTLGEMLVSVTPLIPSLMELATSVMPAFGAAASVVYPIITGVAGILTDILKVIVPPLNFVIKGLAETFRQTFEGVKTAVAKAWEFIKPVFDRIISAVKTVINSIKGLPGVGSLFKDTPDFRGGGGSFGPPPVTEALPQPDSSRVYVPTPDVPLPAVSDYVAPPPSTGKKSGAESTRSADDYAVDHTGLPPGLAPEGGLVPNAVQLNRVLTQQFPELQKIGGWREPDGFNEHSSGEALDIMVGSNRELGDRINQFLLQNGQAFGLQYNLWRQTQWNPDGSTSGMDNRGSPTANHMDHVHARVRPGAASPLSPTGEMPALAGLPEGAVDPRLRDAIQRVKDREHGVREAQARYDTVMDKGDKATPREKERAEYALAKAKREHADAIDDLAKKQEKLNSADAKGHGKKGQSRTGDLTKDFGRDLVGGIAEAFGFDGSLFADPTQLGIVKSLSALSKVQFGGDAGTGSGASLNSTGAGAGGGGGGGISSLLDSFMPKGLGALKVAKPQDAPVPYLGGLPGDPGGGSALVPGAQFAASALTSQGQGTAQQPDNNGGGPGNSDYSINFYGPVGNPSEGMGAATEFNIPRARQGVGQL
ncbi:hypothetical protein P5V62_16740 [Mycobacteroides abscessus subsp. massiliense]|uniref:phage tail protein n=1 Tax=Mycobacteroides abscessus TaxID=36809 RepID=UPI0009A88754|nr:hypothetical protein [Mycobacteroides abscessus]MDO2976026.1 hypothetical protein [Mycobacteroides abscessus subsp. massiliense]SKF18664.1 bacteriophage-like membrane protein [Mycobacteroides abscessus subsp. massiliense]SKO40150.1 bacteriophage-like membrane protein [Mycobacteroides abscessus subsp. massiliense]SKY72273.1 bacteriophage-like membrane protein [Mycobacteroides abscessus subsp. massiliense]